MFGNNNGQDNPMGDLSGIHLPGAQPAGGPQFATTAPTDPAQDLSMPEIPAVAESAAPVANSNRSELADLKQQALSQLTPIVDHLDQTPEEKFRTTMMMIQAADDQALIKSAYGAAQAITDEKAKAQALLDVINEINYFTQKQQS